MTHTLADPSTVVSCGISNPSSEREEFVTNDPDAFIKARYAQFEIHDIVEDWLTSLDAQQGISVRTVEHYRGAMLSLYKSMTLHDTPRTLEYLTERAINTWRADLQKGTVVRLGKPAAAPTIVSYTGAVKVFSNKWLKRRYTVHDPLELVAMGKAKIPPKPGFTPKQREAIMDALEGNSFAAVRDRAFVQMVQATACRFCEIGMLTMNRIDGDTIQVLLKGGRYVNVQLQKAAVRDLKVYLGRRRQVADSTVQELWVKETGQPMTRAGRRAIFLRIEAKVGFKVGPHRFRHTVTQMAAKGGAPVADIQAMLHHATPVMTMRYIGEARREQEAAIAVKWGLAS
jgi:site-specific recombinase XerD